jgi:hypothetical protein
MPGLPYAVTPIYHASLAGDPLAHAREAMQYHLKRTLVLGRRQAALVDARLIIRRHRKLAASLNALGRSSYESIEITPADYDDEAWFLEGDAQAAASLADLEPPITTGLGTDPGIEPQTGLDTDLGTDPGTEAPVTTALVRASTTAGALVPAPAAPVTAPADSAPPSKWHAFEALGLPKSKKRSTSVQKLVVSMYRLIGFGILTLIVYMLIGYIATTIFYLANHTWVTPVAISPSDQHVVQMQSQLATQQNERDKLVDELDQAERAIAAEQAFQLEFARAVRTDLDGRRAALDRARQLSDDAAAAREDIKRTNKDYAAQSDHRMADEYAAGLIDRQQMLQGKFQLAQITTSNLSLAERQSELDQRASELEVETRSLDAILANRGTRKGLSYDVLKIKRDYDASKLELARDIESRDRLRASIARQDKILTGISQDAYLRAVSDKATVALVPYDNLEHVEKGTPLYACRFSMLVCHRAGVVLDVLPGEVVVKQPQRDSTMRGQMIEMQLDDADAARHDVLFVGDKPLWL